MIKKYMNENSKKTYEKFDYEHRIFKVKNGTQRVRILPNINEEELDFIKDYQVKINEKIYVDAVDRSSAVVKAVADIWSDTNQVRQNIYRSLKPIERYQVQVVLLSEDGTEVVDPLPKLMALPKTAMAIIFDAITEGEFDLTERDLIVKRSGTGKDTTYEGTHFSKCMVEVPEDVLKNRVALAANRWYANAKWKAPLSDIYKQLGMVASFNEDDMDAFEKTLLED